MNIRKGKEPTAVKNVLYGPAGIGKSTFASQFPDPLFIDTEGGTKQLDVARTDDPKTWDELLYLIDQVAKERPCKTLVIDTADWAEKLCIKNVCKTLNVKGIESVRYGKGYTYLAEDYQKMLNALDKVIAAGIHVVVCAHAQMRKFEQPDEIGAYDRWELKLEKKDAPLLKEWTDNLFFVNYKTYVVTTSNNTKKAQGGQRVMYTTHNPVWDAKNRFGLPEELPFEYSQIEHIFTGDANDPVKVVQDIKQEIEHNEIIKEAEPEWTPDRSSKEDALKILKEYMEHYKVKESQIRQVVGSKGFYTTGTPIENYDTRFIWEMLIDQWDRVNGMIEPEEDIDIEL